MTELIRTAGEPALRRALPSLAALAIGAAVVMGPSGMQPADVVGAIDQVMVVRMILWAAWILVSVGPVRELYAARGLEYLRALPAARWRWWLVQGGGVIALQLPWAALHAVGSGRAGEGVGAGLLAAAMAVVAVVRTRGAVEQVVRLSVLALGAAAVVWPRADGLIAVVAGLVLAVVVPMATARAPERGPALALPPVRGPAPVALALAHAAFVWRMRRAALGRAALLIGVGGAFAVLAARSNHILEGEGLALVALICGSIFQPLAASSIAVPIAEAERRTRWLLDAAGAGPVLRAVAAGLCAGMVGALLGAGFGALIVWGTGAGPADAARVIGAALATGAAWALVAYAVARFFEASAGVDGTKVFAAMLGLGIAALIAVARFGEAALLIIVALGVAAPAITAGSRDRR